MKTLGLYVETIGKDIDLYSQVAEVDGYDISLFYDEIGFNPIQCDFGFFNSSNIWNFTGTLITTSVETTKRAMNIVNKFVPKFLYTGKKENVFELMELCQNVEVFVKNEEHKKEVQRITGKTPTVISHIKEIVNE